MKVNDRIRELRTMNRMTLKEIADRIGVSEGTVQRYESGAIVTIPYTSIEKIADIFGCSPAYLMGWEPEYNRNDFRELRMLSREEALLVLAYRNATNEIQNGIKLILGME